MAVQVLYLLAVVVLRVCKVGGAAKSEGTVWVAISLRVHRARDIVSNIEWSVALLAKMEGEVMEEEERGGGREGGRGGMEGGREGGRDGGREGGREGGIEKGGRWDREFSV